MQPREEGGSAKRARHLSREELAERTLVGGRSVAKPMTSDGPVLDLAPVRKARIVRHRHQQKRWQRRSARRTGSKNRQLTNDAYDLYECPLIFSGSKWRLGPSGTEFPRGGSSGSLESVRWRVG